MELAWLADQGVRDCDLAELPALGERADGFLWLDISVWSERAQRILSGEFQLHPMAITQSGESNHTPLGCTDTPTTPFWSSMPGNRNGGPGGRKKAEVVQDDFYPATSLGNAAMD